MKRLFDILASGLGLVVLGPLFLLLAIWIKLDSSGPVFYRLNKLKASLSAIMVTFGCP